MRRIHRRKDKAKSKPGIYDEFIKKKSGERNGASSATYDDLFGPKPGNDSLDWAAFDEDIESTSTQTTPNSPSLRSSIGKRISSVKSKAKRSGPRISLMGFRGRKPANMDESDLEEVEADRARASEIDEEEVSDVDSMSVASGTSRLSRASFEDVFGRSVVNTDDIDDDFQFNNPSKWHDNSAAKEAVYDVLAKGGSTMHMARKLFLLEQLKHPAPPSEPPVYWNRTAGINGARNRRNKNRKSFYVVPSAGEAEDGVMPEVFWTVGDVVSHAKHIDLGWPIRADFLLDTAKHLGKLHHGGYVHGSLQAKNVLLDDNLHVYLRSCSTLRPMTKKEFRSHESRNSLLQKDIFWVGVLILELALGLPLSQMECPSLRSAIKMEEKMRFDELEELNDEVDTEIRSLLKDVEPPIPSSLVELCAQCVSPVRINRPEADDIIDWLKDLRSDLEDPDTPSRLDVARHVLGSQRLALKPAVLFDVAQVPTNFDEDGDGYESEDSYAPPEGAEEAGLTVNGPRKKSGRGSSGGNMLQAFLSATADSSRSNASLSSRHETEKPRPKSMMLPTGLNSMFDSVGGHETSEAPELSGSSSMFDGAEHRPRRRSLDRGYYFARNQAMEQHDDVDRRQLISKANMQKFKKAVMTKLEAMSTKPIDPEKLAKRLDTQEVIGTDEAAAIIKRADTILRSEPNLLQLNAVKSGGVTVVGDIHGQYYDLRNLIRLAGQPGSGKGKTTYLFLGDFVDRGDWGAEVMLYLFALKAYHPAHVWLLRGNHEARSVSSFFGFKEECEKKYGLTIYNRFCEAFQAMPIASTIDTATGKFLCLHGGISPNVETLAQFIEFDRFVEPAMNGFLCDVLWSDPVVDPFESGEDQTLNEFLAVDYLPNSQRGCAYRFGFRAIVSFLAVNGLVGVIRAHEVKEEGYCYHFQDLQGNGTKAGKPDNEATPPVITVFSAPNYCGRYGNKAAFLRVLDKPLSKKHRRKHNLKPIHILNPVQYTAVEHPEPVQFEETEQQKQSVRIETTCPYMPSTFNAFIRKAIELGEAEARRGLVRRKPSAPSLEEVSRKGKSMSKRASKKEKKPPPMPPRQASSDTLTDGSTKSKPSKSNWKAAELLGFDEGAAASTNKAKHKAPNKQYADAAASDGINEMNPLVVQDKMKAAKSKLKPNQLKGKILVSKSGSHHSLLKNKDRSASEAARDASLVPKDVATKPPDGDTITFSTNELIALQMLYLLIDHRDKGFITAEDLVQWSAEEGATVRLSEAQMCISYVDADMDSKVGFEDYLVFAAKNKENWLIKQYNKVMTQVKILQSESSTSLV